MDAMHTLGPWSAAPRPWSFDFVRGQAAIVDANGQPVAFVSSTRGKFEPEKANAEHAIQRVNAHDQLVAALKRRVDDAEQAAFEEWLAITRPSGDVEQVHRQWERSSAHEDFYEAWKDAIAAIAEATS